MNRPAPTLAATAATLAALAFALVLPAPALAQSASEEVKQCYADMWADPAIAPLAARLAGPTPEAMAQLRASTARASDSEKPAIALWKAAIEKCQQLNDREMQAQNWPAEGQAIVQGAQADTSIAIAQLYAGYLTWGQHVTQATARGEVLKTTLLAYMDKMRAEDAQEAAQKSQKSQKAEKSQNSKNSKNSQKAEMARPVAEPTRPAAGAAPQAPASFPIPSPESDQCYAAIWANPAIAPVTARLRGTTPEAMARLRASTDKASAEEQPAIRFWLTELKKCQQIPTFVDWPAQGQALMRSIHLESNQAIVDVQTGQLTWGQFLDSAIDRFHANQAQIGAYHDKLQAERAQQAPGAQAAATGTTTATTAPQPRITREAVAAYSQCYGTLWDRPGLEPVKARLLPQGRAPGSKVEYSPDKVSAQEKPALLAWLAEMDRCQQVTDLALADAPETAKTVVRNWHADTTKVIRYAHQGELTWGELLGAIIVYMRTRDTQFKALLDQQSAEQKQPQAEGAAPKAAQ